ncbi:hypothetical protein ACS0TY_021248 [Phlomoides rotata]
MGGLWIMSAAHTKSTAISDHRLACDEIDLIAISFFGLHLSSVLIVVWSLCILTCPPRVTASVWCHGRTVFAGGSALVDLYATSAGISGNHESRRWEQTYHQYDYEYGKAFEEVELPKLQECNIGNNGRNLLTTPLISVGMGFLEADNQYYYNFFMLLTTRDVSGEFVEYYLDNEDEDWLQDFNKERNTLTAGKIMRPILCVNLAFDAHQFEIERLFKRYGRVDRVDMKSGLTFVYMEDERDAEDVIQKLNRIDFGRKGCRLRDEWTKVIGMAYFGCSELFICLFKNVVAEGLIARGNLQPTQNLRKTLFVTNFDPVNTRARDIERHFEQYGKILNVRIKRNFSFVQYELQEDATWALETTHMRFVSLSGLH